MGNVGLKIPEAKFIIRFVWLIMITALLFIQLHDTAYSQNRTSRPVPSSNNGNRVSPQASNLQSSASTIRPADLDKWMFGIIWWAVIIGALGGAVLGWFYLSRLEYEGSMQGERKARRNLFIWLIFIVLPAVLLGLFFDLYFIRFPGYSFFPLMGTVFSLHGVLMTILALLAFTIGAGVAAFLRPDSRCPYLLLPKPKGK